MRPLAPFDSAPPPQFGGAEASVPRPARGTGPNARLRARTRFPPIYLEPNLHAIIVSLSDRRRPRRRRRLRGPQVSPGRRLSSSSSSRRCRFFSLAISYTVAWMSSAGPRRQRTLRTHYRSHGLTHRSGSGTSKIIEPLPSSGSHRPASRLDSDIIT